MSVRTVDEVAHRTCDPLLDNTYDPLLNNCLLLAGVLEWHRCEAERTARGGTEPGECEYNGNAV